ncbi:MAG: hypothetical protein ACI9GW_002544 [Halieaceae bacterium]|jgi:hypothetical protein
MIESSDKLHHPFVPAEFVIPEILETTEFRLRMLTINDLVKDYDAVMSSVEHLKKVWPDSGWPEGLTLEENLVDLGWHQHEFLNRSSFAYTMTTLDESLVLGCLYINPTRKPGYDAEVYLWVRSSELESGLEGRLYAAVETWLEDAWPLKAAAFPCRSIEWKAWEALPDEKR